MWLLNREGGEAQKLTETIQDVDAYAWSPAGDRIVLELQDPSINEIEAARDKDKSGRETEGASVGDRSVCISKKMKSDIWTGGASIFSFTSWPATK